VAKLLEFADPKFRNYS